MSSRTAVLVVDDEQPLRDFIRKNLAARGFAVHTAANGLEALALFNTHPLNLIILDVMMPTMDGLETTRRIRQSSLVPIIILTALGEEKDKVAALDLGADDYLTKPFGVEELMARVRAVLRRAKPQPLSTSAKTLQAGDLLLDPAAHVVTRRGEPLKFTPTEFDLLYHLMLNAGKVVTHRELLQRVWGAEYGDEAEYLRVYIRRLRQKVEADPLNPRHILTEHGVGYRFE
ncbi:MAG TPA: response regulator transcription factor [Anaerolineales bacterium]|nr:response regulator transcription factor [Anaerolineales bacterium]